MAVIANTANDPLKIKTLLPLLRNLSPNTALILGFTGNKKYLLHKQEKTCRAPFLHFAHNLYMVRTAAGYIYAIMPQISKEDRLSLWRSDNYRELDFLPPEPLPEYVVGDDPMAETVPTVGMLIESLTQPETDSESVIHLAQLRSGKLEFLYANIIHLFTFPTLDLKQVCMLGNDMCAWNEYENMVIQGNELMMGRQRFLAAAAELGMETTSTAKYELRKYKKLGRD